MTYLGKGGQIPYLRKDVIAREAEVLRGQYWDGTFPIDVESICDELDIAIIPVVGLSRDLKVDAFISTDFKTIYVDHNEFERSSHRYRFSIAHELGHYVLHKKYCPENAANLNEWLGLFRRFTNDYAEFQANYFAGSLLVPENELIRVLDDSFGGSFAKNYWNASPAELGKILNRVRRYFMVSDMVIARRMRDAFPGVEDGDALKY